MAKLKFLKSRGYLGTIVRDGATIEVDEFWSKIFLADGTAELAEAKAADPLQENSPTPKPKRKR
jgi:hypothetical protein